MLIFTEDFLKEVKQQYGGEGESMLLISYNDSETQMCWVIFKTLRES